MPLDYNCLYCGQVIRSRVSHPRKYCAQACFQAAKSELSVERISTKIDKLSTPDGCWPWTGAHTKTGYGHCTANGTHWLVHRLIWTLANGPIPEGMDICHHCDRPACARLDHLFLGTAQDNVTDMIRKGRGFAIPPRHGTDNQAARLTEDEVRQIRALHAPRKVTYTHLAERFNVDDNTIAMIVRREIWKHVP